MRNESHYGTKKMFSITVLEVEVTPMAQDSCGHDGETHQFL